MTAQTKNGKMVRSMLHFLAAAICMCLFATRLSAQTGKQGKLQCESLTTPIGMDVEHPRLSWQLRDARDGARQTAYKIEVASSPSTLASGKPDVWDSGRIESDTSNGVPYPGPELQPSK